MKTAADLKQQAKKLNINHWVIEECAGCYNNVFFEFTENHTKVFLYNDCTCARYKWFLPSYEVSWETVAHHFMHQGDDNYIKRMLDFWQFEEESKINLELTSKQLHLLSDWIKYARHSFEYFVRDKETLISLCDLIEKKLKESTK